MNVLLTSATGCIGHRSNSRIRSVAARCALGWSPSRDSLLMDITAGYHGAIV